MGMLGGLLGNLMGGRSQEEMSVASALLNHFHGSGSGGLMSLLQGFHNAGLGSQANSWVSTGPNHPVTPDQVESGVGSGFIDQIANRAGISPTVAKVALAAVLPLIVDHLTPHGRVQDVQKAG